MKLEAYKNDYYYFSGKVSDLTRNLSFMGFGAVWLLTGDLQHFRNEAESKSLIWVMIFLVASLAFDFFQYSVQAFNMYFLFKKNERMDGVHSDKDYSHSEAWNWGPQIMFFAKIVAMITAYVLLFKYLLGIVMG